MITMESMKHLVRSIIVLLLLLVVAISSSVAISPRNIPSLRPLRNILKQPEANDSAGIPEDYEVFFYNQTLDHFNYQPQSYETFKQKYVINSKYWGGANITAPIFAYLGEENDIDGDIPAIGFLNETAPRFKAFIVYIEHRFYGESNPLGSMEESLRNSSVRGYFNSAQALADYAEILMYLKSNLSAPNSPIIVFGGSYGGMLASWFRLKYPHIALGALASSAPILYLDNITPQDGYYSVVSKDFKESSKSCYRTIQRSWSEIDKVASQPDGLSTLSKRFKSCAPLETSSDLKDYLETIYTNVAQYNAPPEYPVDVVCRGIDGAKNGTNILDRIFAGLVTYRPNRKCYNTTPVSGETRTGWQWQTCSDLVFPIGVTSNDSIVQRSPFDLEEHINDCKSKFGVSPRSHWSTTYYGGQNIKLVLKRFGSNIIFSNGLKDPYSCGGVLEDISESIRAIHTNNGSHCLDILTSSESDPQWLIDQRKTEVGIIQGWLRKYYADLQQKAGRGSSS